MNVIRRFSRLGGRSIPAVAFTVVIALVSTPAGSAQTPAQQQGGAQASPSTGAPQSAGPGADYVVGARDLLDIRVFGLDDFNSTVRVSEIGTISLPLIGDLPAAGMTRAELEDSIETALSGYLRNPQVTVFIREYQSSRFSIFGAVSRPGTYELQGQKTLLEAISDAGGINNVESAGNVTVIRPGFDGAPIDIDLRQLLDEGNTAFNIEINGGDTINVVPKRQYFIYVYGQVRTPGQYQLRDNVTLLQAISLAGGLGDRAAKKKIRILRAQPDGSKELMEVNLEDIEEGKKPDIPIRPNDVIIVPETIF